MPDSIKRIEERQILANFLKASRLEALILREGESPDFTLSIDGRMVGIEVTQIQKSAKERARESYLQEVIRRARDDYSAAGAPPRCVNLQFSARAPRTGDSRRDLAREISTHLAGQPDDAGLHTHRRPQLPPLMARHVENVSFWRTDEVAIWQSIEATWVAPFTVELFQERVDAKHEKLESYRQGGFDEIWLLIGAGLTNPSQRFDSHVAFDASMIRSRFDRTVFCDGWHTFELGARAPPHG